MVNAKPIKFIRSLQPDIDEWRNKVSDTSQGNNVIISSNMERALYKIKYIRPSNTYIVKCMIKKVKRNWLVDIEANNIHPISHKVRY